MAVPRNADSTRHLGGIDLLRIGAMGLVTAQHALSLTEHQEWSTFRSLNIGQLGVAIFLAISALLASTSRRQPNRWLAQRLERLYPPYWLAMIGCFTIAGVTQYKQFGFYQVVCQLLGVGLFTHPQNLVNVPTWFISLILVCYFGQFLVRLSRRPRLANLAAVALIIAWSTSSGFRWPWIHLISFFATSAIVAVIPERRRAHGFLAVGVGFVALAPWSVAFAYTGFSLLTIGGVLKVPKMPWMVTQLADHCYEYYLVHGVALILATSTLRNYPVIAVVCGVLLAALGAVLLKRLTGWPISRCVPRSGDSPPNLALQRTPAAASLSVVSNGQRAAGSSELGR